MRKLRSRLTYANVTATLALVIAVAGGTAYAADTIGSSDVIDNSLLSADLKNNQAVKSADVANENLTGADIANQSGVDTCVNGVRIGQLCFRAENFDRPWEQALRHCANLDMRAPTTGEAFELVQTHDLPNVDEDEYFWTSDNDVWSQLGGPAQRTPWVVNDGGTFGQQDEDNPAETACVTTPTN